MDSFNYYSIDRMCGLLIVKVVFEDGQEYCSICYKQETYNISILFFAFMKCCSLTPIPETSGFGWSADHTIQLTGCQEDILSDVDTLAKKVTTREEQVLLYLQ